MIRRTVSALLFAAFALMLMALPIRAQAEQTQWETASDAGSCSVVYESKPDHAVVWRQMAGFLWTPQGDFSFFVADLRLTGLESLPLRVESATGSVFSGDAARLKSDAKDAVPGKGGLFFMRVGGRKDLENALYGDLTFIYEDRGGHPVRITAPFGLVVPRTDACTTNAVALASAQPGEAASQEGPAARAPAEGDIIGNGSGVAVDAIGHVVTNEHVVSACGRLTSPGLGEAEVVAVDKASDLALLRFQKAPPGSVAFRAGGLRLGEPVMTAGFPLYDMLQNGLNITTGNLSALSGMEGDRRQVQFSAPTQHGNSGGPLLDRSGRLIGLVEAGMKAEVAQNLNFAVAAPTIESFLDENGVAYRFGKEAPLAPEEIARQARGHTLLLLCRK